MNMRSGADSRVSELREKIAQLEAQQQAAQVRSPHLKAGLESVLAGLRRQLPLPPPEDEHGDDDGVDDDDDDELSSSDLSQSGVF